MSTTILDLDIIEFEPIIVKIHGVEYPVISINADIEKKYQPLAFNVLYKPEKALESQRKILGLLLKLPEDILNDLDAKYVSLAASHIMTKVSDCKKKQEKKSD